MSSNVNNNNVSNDIGNINEGFRPLLDVGRAYGTIRKQNQSTRRLSTSTSSALALLAFLFFLNVLQRSLDDNKQQGPMVMTRTTTGPTMLRRDFNENNKSPRVKSTTTLGGNNVMVTKYENNFN